MSLDVYLTIENDGAVNFESKIFVRENGGIKELTRAEWDLLYPNREPQTVEMLESDTLTVYSANITRNLGKMADMAGIYMYLWRPGELGIDTAGGLIEPLRAGLEKLRADPEKFKQFNPLNGWGNCEGLVTFTENYLNACIQYPNAKIDISR